MSRPHLSIGEVLTILHAEFPDITISKIRFLESQGLIEPERTPSGYRRFYEPDLSRLRWILFQQRDHFLPLKVIKDRLDSGFIPPGREDDLRAVAGAAAPSGSAAEDTPEEVLGDVQSSDVQSSAVQSGAVQSGAVQSGVRETTAGRPAVRAMSVPAGGAGPDGVSQPELALGGADPVAAADGLAPADLEPTSYPEPAGYEGEASTTDGAPEYGDNDVADDATSGTAGEGNISDFSSWTPPRLSRPPRRADGEDASAGSRLTGDLSSVSLTLRELAAASGVEPAVLEELSRYGVISGRVVAGETVYGDEALIAARLAGRFAVYGIEPRHLRSYRVAADKEMALFEQVVAPLVRQRHPQGARAGDNLAELGELGEQLRRVLLRRIAREYLAGD